MRNYPSRFPRSTGLRFAVMAYESQKNISTTNPPGIKSQGYRAAPAHLPWPAVPGEPGFCGATTLSSPIYGAQLRRPATSSPVGPRAHYRFIFLKIISADYEQEIHSTRQKTDVTPTKIKRETNAFLI